jgi:hypothetical protein
VRLWLGIDPGKSGAVAWVAEDGTYDATKMPETYRDLAECVRDVVQGHAVFAAVENLGNFFMPRKEGKAQQSPRTMAPLYMNYGQVGQVLTDLQVLGGADVTFHFVQTVVWRKRVGLTSTPDKKKRKNDAKQLAQSLFPDTKVTLATADALLIASYARKESP